MWNRTSPGVATAWCRPRISRNGCRSFGFGVLKARSHRSEPNPKTHDNPALGTRKPTARTRAGRSPHRLRTAASWSDPGFTVATRKMAARVSRASTACGNVDDTADSLAACSGTVHLQHEWAGRQTAAGPSAGGAQAMGDLAGGPGFEPRMPGSEPGVLPLNYPPKERGRAQ